VSYALQFLASPREIEAGFVVLFSLRRLQVSVGGAVTGFRADFSLAGKRDFSVLFPSLQDKKKNIQA